MVTVDVPADSRVRRLDQSTSHSMAARVLLHGGHGCPPVRQQLQVLIPEASGVIARSAMTDTWN